MTETDKQETMQEYSLQQRLTAGVLIILLPAFLAYFSVRLAMVALAFTGELLWLCVLLFVLSALSMFCALRIVVSPLQRKFKTGRFLLSRAEAAAKLAERRSKMGAGKPFGPQAKYWIFPLALVTVLLGMGILTIVIAISPCGCSDRSSWQLTIALLFLAAVLLALPAWFLFKTIHRKLNTDSFLPSQEELTKAHASCGKPKSLTQRILVAVLWCFIAIIWTDLAISRQHHEGSAWLAAALSWMAALIFTLQLFRPSPSHCALPITPELPKTPPDAPRG
jgi:hypothetical protein